MIYHIENKNDLSKCLTLKFEIEDKDPDNEEMILDDLIGDNWFIHFIGRNWNE